MSWDERRRDWQDQRMQAEAAYHVELSAVQQQHGIVLPPPELVLNYDQRARCVPDQVARMTLQQRSALGHATAEVLGRHWEHLNRPEFIALDAHELMEKLWIRFHTRFNTEQARAIGRSEHRELGIELHALISKTLDFGISGVPAMPDLDDLDFHKTWQSARELWECVMAHFDKRPVAVGPRLKRRRAKRRGKLFQSGDESEGEWSDPMPLARIAKAIKQSQKNAKKILAGTGLIQKTRQNWIVRVDNLRSDWADAIVDVR